MRINRRLTRMLSAFLGPTPVGVVGPRKYRAREPADAAECTLTGRGDAHHHLHHQHRCDAFRVSIRRDRGGTYRTEEGRCHLQSLNSQMASKTSYISLHTRPVSGGLKSSVWTSILCNQPQLWPQEHCYTGGDLDREGRRNEFTVQIHLPCMGTFSLTRFYLDTLACHLSDCLHPR